MKLTLTSLLAAAMMLAGAGLAKDRPAERQTNQQTRIARGVANGELTKRETRRIQNAEWALHQEIVKDRIDGDGLTRLERMKIEAQQDALSAQIAKQKHDAQKQ